MVTVISTISDDDVVEEADAHQAAGILDRVGEVVVHSTGIQTARRVIVADSKDGGVAEYGLFDDDTNVDADLADASTSYQHFFDESVVLVHQ